MGTAATIVGAGPAGLAVSRCLSERGIDHVVLERGEAAVNAVEWRDFDSVLWATGYRPRYPWLDPGLLDRPGQIIHEGGVAHPPGLYVLGLPFLRRRSSSFLCGLEHDAVDIADHLAVHLRAPREVTLVEQVVVRPRRRPGRRTTPDLEAQ